MLEKVLVGLDGSSTAAAAARFAMELAKPHGAKLLLLVVVPPIPMVQDFYGVGSVDLGRLEEAGWAQARPVEEALREAGADVEASVRFGAPAELLARTAQEWGADLVVVGSRGQGVVRRVMLGSVSDRLVHISERPVLVFHEPPPPSPPSP